MTREGDGGTLRLAGWNRLVLGPTLRSGMLDAVRLDDLARDAVLTQLGLDQDPALCRRNLDRIIERVEQRNNFLWIDMEYSRYVDPTLELFRYGRARTAKIGIAIQSYLYRTEKDIESLVPLGSAVRMVKGAYLEPPDVAFPR